MERQRVGFVIGACRSCKQESDCTFTRKSRTLCTRRTRYVTPLVRWRAEIPNDSSKSTGNRASAGIFAALTLAFGAFFTGAPRTLAASAATDVDGRPVASKDLRYDGRTELDGGEKALSLVITGGAFAALSLWAYRRNREDDELEQIRIREEVERLEKLKEEFMNVDEDEDSLDDEDLLAELSKRIEGQDGEEGDEGGEKDRDDAGQAKEDKSDVTSASASNSTEGGETGGGSESLDMLRRMWDATDDDSTKKPPEGSTGPKAA